MIKSCLVSPAECVQTMQDKEDYIEGLDGYSEWSSSGFFIHSNLFSP